MAWERSAHGTDFEANISPRSGRAGVLHQLERLSAGDPALTALYLRDHRNGLGKNGSTALARALAHNRTLKLLHLFWNSLGDEGASALAEALALNSTLTHLHLERNGIGLAGSMALAQVIAANTSLQHLAFEDDYLGDRGAGWLSQMLSKNSSLTHLNLGGNSIGSTGTAALAAALVKNSSLTSLSLHGNRIGGTGATHLSRALQVNCRLAHLRLEFDNIGDDGTAALAEVVWQPECKLRDLYLLSVGMGGQGAVSLAAPLAVNSTLVHINLAGNQVGDSGAKALAVALELNWTVKNMTLVSNGIGCEGATALARGLRHNCTLVHLDLKGNSCLNSQVAVELSLALDGNHSLSLLGLENPIFGSTRTQVAARIGRTLQRRPPPAPGSFTLNGIALADASSSLGLPQAFEHADNDAILKLFWSAQAHHCRCLVAFAMALHPRLGQASCAHMLDDGILTVVEGHVDVGAWLGQVGECHGEGNSAEEQAVRVPVLRQRLATVLGEALYETYGFTVGPTGASSGWSAGLKELEDAERRVEGLLEVGPVARVSYAYSPPLQTGRDCVMLVDVCLKGDSA